MRADITCGLVAAALTVGGALTGCNQSLFDSNVGTGDPRDGGPSIDAAPTLSCPEPCVGDAFADFGEAQGGESGEWFYLAEGAAPSGADYVDLAFSNSTATLGSVPAWSDGSNGPAIAKCDGSSEPACAGLDGYILLAPQPGGPVPALSFRAPESASYRVSGSYRVADGSTDDVAARFLLSRNGKHDATVLKTLRTSKSDGAIDGVVSALVGDELILSATVADGTTPIGFRLYFTRIDTGADMFPGSCQAALTFSTSAPFEDSCSASVVSNLNDGNGPGMSTTSSGASARLGDARLIDEAQYMRLGNSPMDYSGDFTVQFWSKAIEPQPSFQSAPFADWNVDAQGGMALFFDDNATFIDLCYFARGSESRDECLRGSRSLDGEWHFFRIVRSRADESLTLCIDGVENVTKSLPADLNMTSDQAPHIGRNVTYNPAYYGGSIDDFRVYSSALPCSTVFGQ